jgi:D-glycero-D-manno-heptose 1,7-bisphosphate phosphatase
MFPFAAAAIRQLNDRRLPVIVVTNQSGVARGYFPESLVHTVHEMMNEQLRAVGAWIDALYYCPHSDEAECHCRKPKPGMLEQAAREHGLDLARSFVVGDRYGDVELAHRARARGVLVRTGYGEENLALEANEWPEPPDFVAADLAAAVEWILEQTK